MILAGLLNLILVRTCTFEALSLQMQDANGDPIVITNDTVSAQVRTFPGDTLVVDLNPSVTDGPNGIVTIPEISQLLTGSYELGNHRWDLILIDSSGDPKVRLLYGEFNIIDPITDA